MHAGRGVASGVFAQSIECRAEVGAEGASRRKANAHFLKGKALESIDVEGRTLLKQRLMLRPSNNTLVRALALVVLASPALGLTGCKTIYTDVYRPKRNYFKPEKVTPKAADVLPPVPGEPGAGANPLLPDAGAGAGAPGVAPAEAAPPADPSAPAPLPTIPGL